MNVEFLRKWFEGKTKAGREVATPERFFMRSFEDFMKVLHRADGSFPVFLSVNPYSDRNILFGLEKLFFDCDSEDLNSALEDALRIKDRIEKLDADALVNYSGGKGYHAYCFLPRTITTIEMDLEALKRLQKVLCLNLLGVTNEAKICEKYPTLDIRPLFDLKRVSRVPFSIHEKTKQICRPLNEVDLDRIKSLPDEFLDRCMKDASDLMAAEKAARKRRVVEKSISGLDELALEIVENVTSDFDGRKRTINFLIIPRLLLSGYAEQDVIEICKKFIENSGKSWYEYERYVTDCLKRNEKLIESEECVLYRIDSFLKYFPDLEIHLRRVVGEDLR